MDPVARSWGKEKNGTQVMLQKSMMPEICQTVRRKEDYTLGAEGL